MPPVACACHLTARCFRRLPPGQEIEPRQLSPHFVDRIGAKSLLLSQRVDAIEKICKHHGDNTQVVEKLHKLCLSIEQDGMKVLSPRGCRRLRDCRCWGHAQAVRGCVQPSALPCAAHSCRGEHRMACRVAQR